MPYVLTEQDIKLISDVAGAFNCGIALQPHAAARFGNIGIPAAPDSSPDVNPSIKWSQADELRALAIRAQGGGVTYPVFNTNQKLTPGATGVRMTMNPNICYLFECTGAGNGSASQDEGGVGIAGGAFGSAPASVTLQQLPVQGGRAIFPVPVVGGNMLGVMILGDLPRSVLTDIRTS